LEGTQGVLWEVVVVVVSSVRDHKHFSGQREKGEGRRRRRRK